MSNFRMRKFKEDDGEQILSLLNLVSGKKRDLTWWEWFYLRNPIGQPVIWVAEDGGKIIGHRAFVPFEVKVGDRFVLAGQAVDTVTHPDYRKRKIFTSLTQKGLEEAKVLNYSFIFNFPNENSLPGYLKLGWKKIGQMPMLIKMLKWNLFLRKKKLPEYSIKEISFFDDNFDDLTRQNSNQQMFLVSKRREYLNWRYIDNPSSKCGSFSLWKGHQLVGYIILNCRTKNGKKMGSILEFFVLPEHLSGAMNLIDLAIEHFRRMRMDLIVIWPNSFSKGIIKALKSFGFHYWPLSKSRFVLKDIHLREPAIFNIENWYISLGDLDTYVS